MYIVKAFTGQQTGWKEIKRFSNAADADLWLMEYVRKTGYSITDFRIVIR